jgi:hypothetical protein
LRAAARPDRHSQAADGILSMKPTTETSRAAGERAQKSTPSTTAGPIVVGVDLRGALDHEPREAGLDAGQHGIDAGMALARHQRIAIAAGLLPGAGDVGLAARRIGLVPGGEVGLDGGFGGGRDGGWVRHGDLLERLTMPGR